MFDKVSFHKLENIAKNSTIELDVEYFFNYLFTNIMYINLKGKIDMQSMLTNKETYLPIFEKYNFIELFSNFNDQLVHTNLMETIEIITLDELNIRKENIDLDQQEAFDILNQLEKILKNKIRKFLLQYDRETCLQILYIFSGMLSYININNKYWDEKSAIAKDHLNFITELLHTKYSEKNLNLIVI